MITRILAHNIVYDGKDHRLSVAEISADGRSLSIYPFSSETPATVFVSGTVEVYAADGVYRWRHREAAAESEP